MYWRFELIGLNPGKRATGMAVAVSRVIAS
jgi:hypothetical protein